jgi:hypothetical protein
VIARGSYLHQRGVSRPKWRISIVLRGRENLRNNQAAVSWLAPEESTSCSPDVRQREGYRHRIVVVTISLYVTVTFAPISGMKWG